MLKILSPAATAPILMATSPVSTVTTAAPRPVSAATAACPGEAGGEDRDDRAVDEEGHRQREEGLHREPRRACAAWITPAREKAGAGANEMRVRNSKKSRKLNERYQKDIS